MFVRAVLFAKRIKGERTKIDVGERLLDSERRLTKWGIIGWSVRLCSIFSGGFWLSDFCVRQEWSKRSQLGSSGNTDFLAL